MTPERWRQIEGLYHAAQEHGTSDRRAFLAGACRDDDDLKREVEFLLAQDGESNILDHTLASPASKPLSAGDKLGPYEITGLIGAGGMGQVYRARDPRLRRDVALKILTAEVSRDPERRHRFEREAHAVAALNHPNIVAIYDVGESEGVSFIVTELVDGEPLRTIGLSLRKSLDMAVQIASALAFAHQAGIVHRDLKPANIMVTPKGVVKVLDFGLAKLVEPPIAPEDETLTSKPETQSGMLMGTPSFMSPEQAEGKAVDARSDIFSFGAVLYEMVTGKRAFQGDSMAAILAAVLQKEPEAPSRVAPNIPRDLERIIQRCLRKDPNRRHQTMSDVKVGLEDVLQEPEPAESALPAAATGSRHMWPTAAIAAAALGLGLTLPAWFISPKPADLSTYKFTPIATGEATKRNPAWSPDGKLITYTASVRGIPQVFSRVIGSGESAQLTHSTTLCNAPFWSPDGGSIYYTSGRSLWAVAATGGAPERVLDNASGASLHPNGKILLFGRQGKLWTASPTGTRPPTEFWWQPAQKAVAWSAFSPDGAKIAVVSGSDLWILPYTPGATRKIAGPNASRPSWFPDSRHLAMSWGRPPRAIAILDVADGGWRVVHNSQFYTSPPSVSPDGKRIAFSTGQVEWNVLEGTLATGVVHKMPGVEASALEPDWAPDGSHYLVSTGLFDEDRHIEDVSLNGFSRRLAEGPHGLDAMGPRWAPDGTRFVFLLNDYAGRMTLMLSNASGGHAIAIGQFPNSVTQIHTWSPDGQWLAAIRILDGKQRLVKVRPAAGATPVILSNAEPVPDSYSDSAEWSPAGNWILYPSAGGMSLVSPDGVTVRKMTSRKLAAYNFSKDGRQVLGIFHNTSGEGAQWHLYSVDVATGAEKMVAPVDLPASTWFIGGFSMHPDGKRFLTAMSKWPYDIWMLEGFDPPRSKTWLERLLRR